MALTDTPQRLPVDHDNARRLAEGLVAMPQIDLDLTRVHTNIVVFRLRPGAGMTAEHFAVALKARGVLILCFRDGLRATTHFDVDTSAIPKVLTVVQSVLGQ